MVSKAIDLREIASKLIASNEQIKEKAKSQTVVITAKTLSKKVSELTPLNDIPLISIRMFNNVLTSLTPSLYENNAKPVICLPDLNASTTEDFELVKFKTGKLGFTQLKHKDSGVEIITNFVNNLEHLAQLELEDTEGIEGKLENLEIEYLREKPQIELPLRILPQDVTFKIVGKGKKSREFSTDLVDVQTSTGKIFKNVICNADLARLVANNGKSFKITNVTEVKQKIRKGKDKGKTQTVTKVQILPLDGKSFADLTI